MTKCPARSRVDSEVSSEGTSSTRGRTGTGLKKWIPMTCPGRVVAVPSRMIGMEEVLEARIASGSVTIRSSAARTLVLACSCSATASITS